MKGSRPRNRIFRLAPRAAICLIALSLSSCLETSADQPWSAKQDRLAKDLILTHNCGTCHTLRAPGLDLRGGVGPDLTRQALRGRSRQWLRRQLTSPRSIPDSEVAPGFEGKQRLMPPLRASEEELEALVGFLSRLE